MHPEIVHWRGVNNDVHAERHCKDLAAVSAAVLPRGLPPDGAPYGKRDARFVPSTFPAGWAAADEESAEA
eukprot:12687796-Alexandrium_andersonii.AAC.1